MRTIALVLLCSQDHPDLELARAVSRPVLDRAGWAEAVKGLEGAKTHREVDGFLKRLRGDVPHRPSYLGGGASFDLYALDAEFELHVAWKGESPADGLRAMEILTFADLRPEPSAALRAIHDAPSPGLDYGFYDPVPLLRAVNTLHRLGETDARRALRAYVDLCRKATPVEAAKHRLDESRVLAIVQLLFENPGGTMPPFRLGAPDVETTSPASWPAFPLALEGDIPFMLVHGYTLFGAPPDAAAHLSAGRGMRTSPLTPRMSPVEAVDLLLRSERWTSLRPPAGEGPGPWRSRIEEFVRAQALGGVAGIFSPRWDRLRGDCCEPLTPAAWRAIVEQSRGLGIHWDPARQDFVRKGD